jgi:hypothetical protein
MDVLHGSLCALMAIQGTWRLSDKVNEAILLNGDNATWFLHAWPPPMCNRFWTLVDVAAAVARDHSLIFATCMKAFYLWD